MSGKGRYLFARHIRGHVTKTKRRNWVLVRQPRWHWEVRDHKGRVLAYGDEYEWKFAIQSAHFATTDIRGAMFWGCRVKRGKEDV